MYVLEPSPGNIDLLGDVSVSWTSGALPFLLSCEALAHLVFGLLEGPSVNTGSCSTPLIRSQIPLPHIPSGMLSASRLSTCMVQLWAELDIEGVRGLSAALPSFNCRFASTCQEHTQLAAEYTKTDTDDACGSNIRMTVSCRYPPSGPSKSEKRARVSELARH